MGPGLLAAGWLAALLAAAVAFVVWRLRTGTVELVARASHELRGPLAAARLGLHLGVRGDGLSEERLRAIDLELAKAALALDDLAQVALGPAPTVGADPAARAVDVAVLVADSVEARRAAAAGAGAELRLVADALPGGADAVVDGDRLRLAQAVGNLIANAIEHGGGVIEVRCHSAGSWVRIEVVDGGPGLPAPVAELVRGSCRRRAQRRHAHGARGLHGHGLAVAAAVAISHGGRLAAAPSERGARLVLELPRAGSDLRSA